MKKLAKLSIIALTLISCGKKKEEKPCRSRFEKIITCMKVHNRRGFHPEYSRIICGQRFEHEKCYK